MSSPNTRTDPHTMGPFTTILQMTTVGDEVHVKFQTNILPFIQTYHVRSLQSVEGKQVVVWAKHEHTSGTVHSFPFNFNTEEQAAEFAAQLRERLPIGSFSPEIPGVPRVPLRFDLACPDPTDLD